MLRDIVIVLGWAVLVVAEVKFIGPCNRDVKTQSNFDLEKFISENGGKWSFVKIPDTPSLATFSNLQLSLQRGDSPGQFMSTITSDLGQGNQRELSKETVTNVGNGVLKARANKDGSKFNVYFLKYKPTRFAYYYICGKDGDDNGYDYRYVLSHTPLSTEDSAEIDKIENELKFQGKLRDLPNTYYY